MSKPTLMIPGKLVPVSNDPQENERIKTAVPYEYILEWLTSRVNKTGIDNRVLIVKSETASGKSTLLPAEIYKKFVHNNANNTKNIICTQPRILTTIENVTEIMKNYNFFRIGVNIGWSTKNDKMKNKQPGLLSATVGTLAQEFKAKTDAEIMATYKFIMIDETHERDLQIDIVLMMLKKFLARNSTNEQCPFVLLLSATFDERVFLKYFNVARETNFIWCRGQTAGFDIIWNEELAYNYRQSAIATVQKILKEGANDPIDGGDIIIFVSGKGEMDNIAAKLHEINTSIIDKNESAPFALILITGDEVKKRSADFLQLVTPIKDIRISIDNRLHKISRRIILATNVAETGVTLDNLKYVIDSGYNKEIEYNPILGIDALVVKPAPQSRIIQRRGRAGRKFRGVFYPLYPKRVFEMLPEFQMPQILTSDIGPIMLDIIKQTEDKPEFLISDIDMIDVPTPDALAINVEKLYAFGFVSIHTNNTTAFNLTPLGNIAAKVNNGTLSLETIRAILAAYSWDMMPVDIITMLASSSISSFAHSATKDINWPELYIKGLPLQLNVKSPIVAAQIRAIICDDFIDALILYEALMRATLEIKNETLTNRMMQLNTWCEEEMNISFATVMDFIAKRNEIIEQFLNSGFEIYKSEPKNFIYTSEDDFINAITKLKYCLYDGFKLNVARLAKDGNYYTRAGLKIDASVVSDRVSNFVPSIKDNDINYLPRAFIYSDLKLVQDKKATFIYKVHPKKISVIDGYINYDLTFLD